VFHLVLKQNDLLKFDRDGTAIIIPSLMRKNFNDVFQLYYTCPKKRGVYDFGMSALQK
jgi:hypothetical protein